MVYPAITTQSLQDINYDVLYKKSIQNSFLPMIMFKTKIQIQIQVWALTLITKIIKLALFY